MMPVQIAEYIGIDISQHNGQISWSEVVSDPQNVKFVFIKATEGTTLQDRNFEKNRAGANSVGMPNGHYHFYSLTSPPESQAQNFINVVKTLGPNDLPPVLDIEKKPESGQISPEKLANDIQKWIDLVEEAFQIKPIIYTYRNYWESYIGKSINFTESPLWIANYGKNDSPTSMNIPPSPLQGWEEWSFWQYTSKGNIKGIVDDRGRPTNVDLNRYNIKSGILKSKNIPISTNKPNNIGFVNTDRLNIRNGASLKNDLIALPLRKNQEVMIIEENNGWYRVKTEIEGWVSKTYIELKNE